MVVKFPRVKIQRIASQQLHIECYHVQGTGLGAKKKKKRTEINQEVNQHDCYSQVAEDLLGETAGQQIISDKHGHCLIHTPLDLPSEGLETHPSNPGCPRDHFRESPLWELVFFSHRHIHREVWEYVLLGDVCSVNFHFCHLS